MAATGPPARGPVAVPVAPQDHALLPGPARPHAGSGLEAAPLSDAPRAWERRLSGQARFPVVLTTPCTPASWARGSRLDLGLDPFQGGAHVVAVGLAPGPAQQCPVQSEPPGVGQTGRLGDVGPAVGRLHLVAPHAERLVPRTHPKGEGAARLALPHRAGGPVDGADPVALH